MQVTHPATALLSGYKGAKLLHSSAMETEALAAQSKLPASASFLSMVDRNYLFDLSRNHAINVDMPAAVSPAPGIPCGKGGEMLVGYLQKLGIDYVIRTLPDKSLMFFKRDYWLKHPRPEKFYKTVWAPPMLGIMSDLDEVATTRKSETIGNLQVICLRDKKE